MIRVREERTMQKNLLLITADHWPYSLLHSTGDNAIMTPTLDAIARDGVTFSSHYSTCPVCIPARRSLMTGLFPSSHGDRVYSYRMKMPDVTTLAQAFRSGGYQAYAVGKLHVYPQRNRIGFDDVVLEEEGRDEFGSMDDYALYLGDYGHAGEEFLHGMGSNSYMTRPWHLEEKYHPTAWATREMCRMIARKDPTRPTFYYLSYIAPHPPLVPIKEYLEMYDSVEMPVSLMDDWSNDAEIIRYFQEAALEYSENDINRAKKAFYAQCTYIDHQMRIVIGTLKEHGLLDDTIIAFTSDHGDSLFDHGIVGKRNFLEGSAHVPCIIGGKPLSSHRGERRENITCHEDLMPTLLTLCGLPVPSTVEGKDMFTSDREYLYGEISEGLLSTRMVVGKKYKLIYYPAGNYFLLFDRINDNDEKHNIFTKQKDTGELKEMMDYLVKHLHGDDCNWLKAGKLTGFPCPTFHTSPQYTLRNQRGCHWPPTIKEL